MKDVILFKLTYCPHCKLALRLQEELFQAHPEWRDIPLQMIDEAEEPELANSYDTIMSRPTTWAGKRSMRATPSGRTSSGSFAWQPKSRRPHL